ncbi:MAG TPA: DNA polymerase ligase N-terminal domain-containing protein [Phycisphaerae bacterium]|jgi:hypothetical protein|nr:hypothetical protein [Phycisphaerae bacterium]HOB73258.1 DNA polymerase ligase N-terminal domain-containing protein [Phycisphaerae bacterium]HOJ54892.1 DNA polymerase ligase N-terminal domain-containing protein [Phycisphaerae bacterium]HOL26078.1 DNA polymerase ligase N-terminal domain-containing protein [Phycisphaerae bacterium]HPP21532.1 DNA polymerase ligase N-terminal domain-containing protein [Phycisphaerae bacterium]
MSKLVRQYVILRHVQSEGPHWDLMLDQGETLATWQLAADPAALAEKNSPAVIPARRIADHRRAYLTYEGPVSRGRGHVTRIDSGTYELTRQDQTGWGIRLNGILLKGDFWISPLDGQVEGKLQRVGG